MVREYIFFKAENNDHSWFQVKIHWKWRTYFSTSTTNGWNSSTIVCWHLNNWSWGSTLSVKVS